MHKPKEPYIPEPGKRYESDDLPLRPVMRSVIAFFIFTAASGVIAAVLFGWLIPGGFQTRTQPQGIRRRLPPTPLPKLQGSVAVKQDIADLRQREHTDLTSYGWVNRQKGIARIPLDRAVELVEKNGLPDWNDSKPTEAKKP